MPEARFLLVVLLAMRSIMISTANHEGDFIFDSYNDPLVYQNAEYDTDCLIQRLWGIPDTPAYIGYVFVLRIPKDAFSGRVVNYKITGVDGPLPSWLWAGEHGVIKGIPSAEDQGEHRVLVTALTKNHKSQHCSSAVEMFTINVKDKKESPIIFQGEDQCHFGEDETRLIIMINQPFQQISSKRRLNSIIKLYNFMDLDYNVFFIQPHEVFVDENFNQVDGLTSSVSGAKTEHFKELSEIVMTVGCSGVIWTKYITLVHKIEQLVIDGTISEVVHLPVKGWKVVRYKQSSFSRTRRMMRLEGSTFDEDDEEYDRVVKKMYPVQTSTEPAKISEENKKEPVEPVNIPAIVNFPTEIMINNNTETPNNEESKGRLVKPNNNGSMINPIDNSAKDHEFIAVSDRALFFKSTDPVDVVTTVTVDLNINKTLSETFNETTNATIVNFPNISTPEKQQKTRNREMVATSGKYFSFIIPEISFENETDANNLQLALYGIGHIPLQPSSWLQFNPKTKEAYGLPLEDHISKWEYVIEATDSQGVTVMNSLNITVQKQQESLDVNHEFSMKLHIEKNYSAVVDWQIRLIKGLVQLFRDADMNQISVRGVNFDSDFVEFLWINDSLPKHFCARSDILQLMNLLQSNTNGHPSSALITAMSPQLRVISVSWRAIGQCILSYTLVVIPTVIIAVLVMISAFIAYLLYKRGRMGTMSLGVTEKNMASIPNIFESKIKENDQSNKFSVLMKEYKPPLLPTRDYTTTDSNSSANPIPHISTFRPSHKSPRRNSIKPPTPSSPPPYSIN